MDSTDILLLGTGERRGGRPGTMDRTGFGSIIPCLDAKQKVEKKTKEKNKNKKKKDKKK